MFSIVTVASSTRIPTASASPPSVMTLIVSPRSESAVTEARMASGIETVMISVARQLPRKSRIIIPVSAAAIAPFPDHAGDGAGHEHRLIADGREVQAGRQSLGDAREQLLDAGNDRQRRGRARLQQRP